MKIFNKIALVTAISAVPFAAQALESLDDEFLGNVTGQEGITIEQDYSNTIEEFQYIDGDGDGATGPGKVKVTGIEIGEFSGDSWGRLIGGQAPFDPTGALTATHTKTAIDATANGVLITTQEVGDAATIPMVNVAAAPFSLVAPLTNATGDIQWNATQGRMATVADAAGGDLIVDLQNPADGSTVKLMSKPNGKDTRIGGIEIGNANGQLNSIGSVTMMNTGNWLASSRILVLTNKFGVTGGSAGALLFNNANRYIEGQTLISSKASGTGVHIVQEGSTTGAQAAYYEDTDGGAGGNQIGVLGLVQFRLADTNDINSVDRELDSGTYLRGTRSEFDLDVEGGKLVLSNQIQDSNTVLNQIFIGNINAAEATGAGVIGGIAILGNHWEGKTSIYAH